MTTWYVRSTDGNNGDSGLTWALAKANLSSPAGGDGAGDTVFVSQAHSELTTTSIFMTWNGSTATAVSVICGNDAAEPPTAVATTGSVTVNSGSCQIQLAGSHFCYGMNFINNGAANNSHIWLHNGANSIQAWEECAFQLNSAAGSSSLLLNAATTSSGNIRWRNVDIGLGATTNCIVPQCDNFVWEGGSVLAGSLCTGLFVLSTARTTNIKVSGVDFTEMPQAFYFIGVNGGGKIVVRNCKMPAGWTGGGFNGVLDYSSRFEMYNSDDAATNYKLLIQDHTGIISDETTIVRTGGASDGFITYSLKMATSANCNARYGVMFSPEISIWNDVVGSAVTLTVDIAHDSVTALTNAEAWLELEYHGASTSPLTSFATDGLANPLATAAAQTASTDTWTTTGLTNPNKQKLSVSVTPQMRGYIHGRVVLAKASYTVYLDPKFQVS